MNRFISIVFVLSAILLPIAEGYSQNATLFSTPTGAKSITPADYPPLAKPAMRWATDMNYSKDPSVIRFHGKYLLYFSQPPKVINGKQWQWTTGIAQSNDLTHWTFVTDILPIGPGEMEVGAPCVKVVNDRVYMFYQTWQKGHPHTLNMAVSDDGIHFTPSPVQPAFKPSGDWNTNRVIDADYIELKDGRRFLYGASREPTNKIQQIVVATAPAGTDLLTAKWTQASNSFIVKPEFPWETQCIEAPSVIERSSILYMFYGGGYNNHPQHIGVAVSTDGISWVKLWSVPFITNGPKGQWNSSESGHPGIFEDENGQTWLFFQGNCTGGKDWYLSRVKIGWRSPKSEEFNQDVLAKYPELANVQVPFVELESSTEQNSSTEQESSTDPKSGKSLVWSDEFDYPDAQLDERWVSENSSPSHIICSRWRENAVVKDGMLRLNNKKEKRGGKEWTSASITTKEEFCYGYFECRYRYAAATGTNNSFWLMTRNQYSQVTNTTPTTDSKDVTKTPFEIDINEGHYPSEINTNIHSYIKNHQAFHKAFEQDKSMDLSKEFHTYGLLWTPTELVFYFDGKELRREENKVCHSPVPIYLSEAIIAWAGKVTDAIDGTFMEVDYVRVYK